MLLSALPVTTHRFQIPANGVGFHVLATSAFTGVVFSQTKVVQVTFWMTRVAGGANLQCFSTVGAWLFPSWHHGQAAKYPWVVVYKKPLEEAKAGLAKAQKVMTSVMSGTAARYLASFFRKSSSSFHAQVPVPEVVVHAIVTRVLAIRCHLFSQIGRHAAWTHEFSQTV